MTRVRVATNDGGETALDAGAVDALAQRLRGPLCRPWEPGYEEARRLWNAMIDKRPALVARPAGAADVVDCVRFAREHDLLFSVRGGGHNIAGTAVCEGGLMIDLSTLKSVHVDPAARRVRVEPGASWGDVDRETQAFGLVVPGGIVSTTGVAGFTLGGGFGWASRKHGLACDSLRSVDVVTAGGERVRASADEHPELFWALRGGGGNFGIVTSFEFHAHPLGPEVVAGLVLHPMERAQEVVNLFREMTESASEDLCCLLVLRKAPPAPFIPEEFHGAPVAGIAVCYAGDMAAGERAVQPLTALGEPVADVLTRKPFATHQQLFDASAPFGRQYYWKSDYFDDIPPAADEALIGHAEAMTSPLSSVLMMQQGGAIARPREDTAAGNRDAGYILNIQGSWLEPAESPTHTAWAREYWEAMRPFSSGGAYVNFLTRDESEDRVRAAYGAELYDRLTAAKTRYDPANVFRSNQNIRPRQG
ncbi:MAG: FAD-binding oxidoreductase [Gammaproteobacteria bacterium]|nr:FAD-binding oxidoreductase [Gammaproteobacteria bacterium]NIR61450.1 FAD-binding oxidoreductase [Gammaproteobacteria bacterium]NIR91285.1 FAD-binding oxidoreductase [Gammaproteobacteria bacterium]